MNHSGIEFLNKVFKDLSKEEIVLHTSKISENPVDRISKYMDRLERVTNKAVENDRLELLLSFYYDKYIIKEENIPESYFEQQEQIALERGYGHIKITEEQKRHEANTIIQEQKESLKQWLEYFVSEETNYYPMWFKYYVFQSIIKIGSYDKEKGKFNKRTNKTVKPFLELNREAIASLYSTLVTYLSKEDINDEELEELLNNGNFNKIYAHIITKLDNIRKSKVDSNEGIWKKYNKNSDSNILYNDIKGKGTGWCTAGGIETATEHIKGGDFYVYYTKDEKGEYTAPRIAIRMENNQIAEIRGVASNQNIESDMEQVVKEKLEEFPDKDKYLKKVHDMELLTKIYKKHQNNEELTIEELSFLYEIDSKIIGFGYHKDPRIEEIINKRHIIEDLNKIFEQVDTVAGDLNLPYLTSAKGLTFPKHISGNLDLHNLTSAEGLILPKQIGRTLDLYNLTSAEGLVLPEQIGEDLGLDSLISAEGLVLPKRIGRSIDLSDLRTAEGLVLPEQIGGDLYLDSLISAEGLVLPKRIGGDLHLPSLTSAKGLVLPEQIGKDLNLSSLTSAEGLVLPEQIGRSIDLSGLRTAEGLVLPKRIGGKLFFHSLESAKGLELPEDFDIEKQISAPEHIKEELLNRRNKIIIKK